MAEAIFKHHACGAGVLDRFRVDSAGTGGWHEGEPPDSRMRARAEAEGVPMAGRAREIRPGDLDAFDYILCMDSENVRGVLALGPGAASVERMLDYHRSQDHDEVPDPYYGSGDGFKLVFDLLDEACRGLLDALRDRHDLR
jgi:protein-tyrosine phosphatase